MNNLARMGFALALLPAIAACTPNRTNPMAATIPQPVPPTASVSAADTQFALQAAQSDMFEAQSSQMALQKARNPAIRQYAQRMIDYHTGTTRELRDIAGTKSMNLPMALEPQQQQALANLESASPGASFERQYLNGQIEGHTATAGTFRSEIASGLDPDLKSFAQRGLPEVERHLADARRLRGRS